jgi:hypothetical protein
MLLTKSELVLIDRHTITVDLGRHALYLRPGQYEQEY